MRIATVVVVVILLVPESAFGHGPCGCLSVSSGPPGTKVTITGTTAYWVVWNGRGLPQDTLLRSHYRPKTPTLDLVNLATNGLPALESVAPDTLPIARSGVEFTVPRAAEGRYAIVIYDGTEAGEHYTWELFRVTSDQDGGLSARVVLLAIFAAVLLGALLYGASRSRPQRVET